MLFRSQEANRVGEIELFVSVIGLECGEARPQFFESEAVDAGVDFFYGALLGRGGFFFHDAFDAAFGVANDSAVVRRIFEDRAQNCGGGLLLMVRFDELFQGFGAEERRIAGHHEDVFRGLADFAARNLKSVASALLRLLQNGIGAESFDDGADFFGLVADDGEDLAGLERLAGADHVFDERATAGAVENLREFGLHARAFAGREDHTGGISERHR